MPGPHPPLVLHADLDAFYASAEQLDDPSLRGKPVIVGPRSRRGVVLTASYEARPFGVGSAMPMARALRLCPDAVVVSPRMDRYVDLSKQVMAVFCDFSPSVEALSLDEAFLDMTGAEHIFGPPTAMGSKLRDAVKQATGLTISVGISSTKYVAKVASAVGKPDGLLVVPPDGALDFLAPLPIRRLWGVGPKTAPRLEAIGLHRIGDIQRADPAWLRHELGPLGDHVHALAMARDRRRVARRRAARSIGSQRTLEHDVADPADIARHLRRAADRVGARLRRKQLRARGVRVALKTTRFDLLSRQVQLRQATDVSDTLYKAAVDQLVRFDHPGPFRLVGLAAFDLEPSTAPRQVGLFADDSARRRRLEHATDLLVERFGPGVVRRADDLGRSSSSVHGPDMDALDDVFDRLDD